MGSSCMKRMFTLLMEALRSYRPLRSDLTAEGIKGTFYSPCVLTVTPRTKNT